jgi:predicted restriction endonuclease
MNESTEEEISDYLDYIASHMIIISDYINKNNIDRKNIIIQHIEEMSESLRSIIEIVNKDDSLYKEIDNSTNNSTNKIIRDFKIRKIMDE